MVVSCHMFEPQPHASRKRQRFEPDETPQPAPKRQSLHPRATESVAAFYDSLSKVWLTKRALRELDRRNVEVVSRPRPEQQQAHRPITRSITQSRITKPATKGLKIRQPSTLKTLRSFARHGGPDLSHLRNYTADILPIYTMSFRKPRVRRKGDSVASSSTAASNPTTNPTTYAQGANTKTTGPYDRGFQQHLIDSGIYPSGYYDDDDDEMPAGPADEEAVKKMFTRPRASLSPSKFTEKDYREFKRTAEQVSKEKQVSESVLTRTIEGNIPDHRCRGGGIRFNNLASLTGGNLTAGNPDIYYGARPERLNRKVRDDLSEYIVPSTQHDLPIVPTFTLAVKGPDGSAAVAKRQACYDGAQGARAMHMLQSYKQEQPAYGDTAAISSIYHNEQLQMYAHHLTAPSTPGGRPEYHMTRQRSFALTDTLESCREGIKAYRNARDWTAEQRNEAIKDANKRVDVNPATISFGPTTSFGPALSFGPIAGVAPASSFASDTSTEPNTNEPLSQSSEQVASKTSFTTGEFDESETSTEEALPEQRPRGKRPSRQPKAAASSRRKRPNINESSSGPSTSSVPDLASATDPKPGQWWAWANGRFECYVGSDVVKYQKETPADVWVYLSQGWPGEEDKNWRWWGSTTQQFSYS